MINIPYRLVPVGPPISLQVISSLPTVSSLVALPALPLLRRNVLAGTILFP